jgi:predicted AlkP superfamily pyrophosphatase or phosphodiesterase
MKRLPGIRQYGVLLRHNASMRLLVWFNIASLSACFALLPVSASAANANIVIVIDGLRPDYVTHEWMPNLTALGEAGVNAEAHLAVFPSATRINAASIATGTYPGAHGLMHNVFYLAGAGEPVVDTVDAKTLLKIEGETHGSLLTAASLAEVLAGVGKKVFAISSGSSGSALLLNHKRVGGGVLNSRGYAEPESLLARAQEVAGRAGRLAGWVVEAFLKVGLDEVRPDVTLMWLTDPDGAGHLHGLGSPEVVQALRRVDDAIGRLLEGLQERGLRHSTNIFVTADHGFTTNQGLFDLPKLLAQNGLDEGVVVVGGRQVFVKNGSEERIRKIVELLQDTAWVGAIFTRGARRGDVEGFVPGTLSLESVYHDHDRAADILVDPMWTDAVNDHGFAGATTALSAGRYVATHGSTSPYDMSIRLIATGPDIKRGVISRVPTANVDLAPTICRLYGVEPPAAMKGRVLQELLVEGPHPASVSVRYGVDRVIAERPHGRYTIDLLTARVDGKRYLQHTRTLRSTSR